MSTDNLYRYRFDNPLGENKPQIELSVRNKHYRAELFAEEHGLIEKIAYQGVMENIFALKFATESGELSEEDQKLVNQQLNSLRKELKTYDNKAKQPIKKYRLAQLLELMIVNWSALLKDIGKKDYTKQDYVALIMSKYAETSGINQLTAHIFKTFAYSSMTPEMVGITQELERELQSGNLMSEQERAAFIAERLNKQ